MLSVVIISFNEERNIARALLSLQGLSDDIIMVDSGSTDQTEVLGEKYGARVIHREWEGYSAAKNFGNSQARYPWILSLDADEALSDELRQSIRDAFKPDLPHNHAFSFNRLANYCGKWIHHSGWYPDRKIRIWHRDAGQWEGSIHERIVFREKPLVMHLRGNLLHYSYYSVDEHRVKAERYAALQAQALYSRGKRSGYVKLLLAPLFRFVRDYIAKGGFLDGRAGFTICSLSARTVFLKYVKLRKMWAIDRR